MRGDLIKIDQLTPEEMSTEYRVESLAKTEKEIRFLKEKMSLVAKASMVIAFEMGRRLVAVKETLDHGQFLPWLDQSFALTVRTAQKYMKLYERFRGEPAALLDDLSIQEAYVLAGIKKASDDGDTEDDEERKLRFAGKRDIEAERANMVSIFKRPTLSGKDLKNHRVENVGGKIYVYRKDVGTVSPAMDLYLGRPRGLPEPDWIEMQSSYVIATELYLAKVEAYEASGMVEAPEDSRLLTLVDKREKQKGRIA